MGLDRRLLIKKGRNPNVHRAPPRAYYCRADNPRDSLCLRVFDATRRVQATSEEELPYPDPDHPCVSVCCEPRRASVSVAWTLRTRRRNGDELIPHPEDGKIHRLRRLHRFKSLDIRPPNRSPHLEVGNKPSPNPLLICVICEICGS